MSRFRRSENIEGDFFVDSSCIDCDVCRWFCPSVFGRDNGQSAVYAQPETEEEIMKALQAAVACPTGSIRTENPNPSASKAAKSFPSPALDDEGNHVRNVYYNGYTSPNTFAGDSWILRSPEVSVMFDCPRFSSSLARNIGDIDYIVLSHQDDVYGHELWAKALNAKRIIHIDECNRRQKTDECEFKLSDSDFPYKLAEGIQVIHVPGHTKGSIVLLDAQSKSLFSGDHVFGSKSKKGEVTSSTTYCFYSFAKQIESVERLMELDIRHIWPGHGRPVHFKTRNEASAAFREAADRMRLVKNAH